MFEESQTKSLESWEKKLNNKKQSNLTIAMVYKLIRISSETEPSSNWSCLH
jgi:hypothetical protein